MRTPDPLKPNRRHWEKVSEKTPRAAPGAFKARYRLIRP